MPGRYALPGYLVGATAARTGDEVSGPALLLVGLAATGSVATGSGLLAALTISAAIGGPVLGALLDRSHRPGRLLAGALAAYTAGLGVLLAGAGQLPTPLALAVALLTGMCNAAISGGWTAQLPGVVPAERFARANALDALTYGLAGLAGPALAGLLGSILGAPAALLAAIVLVAAALPVAATLPRPATRPPPRSLTRDMRAGFTAIARSRSLLAGTATSVVAFAGVGMLVVCCPVLGTQRFGDAGRGTLLLAVLAATAMAANALLARRPGLLRPDLVLAASTLLLGAGMLTAALTSHPGYAVLAVVIAGLGDGPQLTALFAIRHREAPARLRAQIFTTGASLKISGFALGSALAGPLAATSLTACLLVAAGVELLAALTFLACHRWWPGKPGGLRRPSLERAA
ncbi:MFS transporter [Amycolatopsis aidingensis]|uniref:MFS transporter n=1 Tax=Amycolatopsis aidingensis TaxID=2842453 RepID=UPI001C0B0408|nr:MFS transporter [Amycolatopsis aidingensis]